MTITTNRSPRPNLFLTLAAPLWLLGAACSGGRAAPPPPAAEPVVVDKVTVEQRALPRSLTFTGTLRGAQEAELAANASGRVVRVFVERGDEVKPGAPLAKLDVRAAALTESEASANERSARTQAAMSQAACARAKALLDRGALTAQEYERARGECEASEQGLAAASARRQLAIKAVGDGVIRAPFGGLVTERSLDVGEFVREDSKVASLVTLDPLRVEFALPEAQLGSITRGQEVTVTVAAFPEERFKGKVRFAGGAVRPATRDVIAEAELPNPGRRLRPGMFAVIELAGGKEMTAVIPKSAIVERDGEPHVFALAGGRLEERIVLPGAEVGDHVAISKGVRPGEQVVVSPAKGLKNGQAVR